MLEKMAEFFEARLCGYDAHMLTNIEGAREFYPYTASLLPKSEGASVLDLGCGTGLELEYYFRLNPSARVTGIDLSAGMLEALKGKFADKKLNLICGSYFDIPLGEGVYDAAVSVESLHHFTKEEKTAFYKKVFSALKDNGCFVLTDYFAKSEDEEKQMRSELERQKAEQGITDGGFYHYDTPLTVENETEALLAAGFLTIEDLISWGATHCLIARKNKK